MKVAGGVVALIAGLFSVIMAFLTLTMGGLGAAFNAEGAETVIGLGWAGVFLSLLIVTFSTICIFAKTKFPAITLLFFSIVTAIAGGTFVAIFMVLAVIGGLITLIGVSKEIKIRKVAEQ